MFYWSICDPLNPEILEKGSIQSEKAIQVFKEYPWEKELSKIDGREISEIFYSPSIEIRNEELGQGLVFSAVPDEDSYIFYAFYKRPKLIKKWFGFSKEMNDSFVSDKLDLQLETCVQLIELFIDGNNDQLEHEFQR